MTIESIHDLLLKLQKGNRTFLYSTEGRFTIYGDLATIKMQFKKGEHANPNGEYKKGRKPNPEHEAKRIANYKKWMHDHPKELKEHARKAWATRRLKAQLKRTENEA